jgi:hypothetical protein
VPIVVLQSPEIKLNGNANVRLMESSVNPCSSNRYRALTDLARCCAAVAATVVASALALPALANTITFNTALPPGNLSGSFNGPVTEDGFTYSKLNGELRVNPFGNPGQDAEGNISGGGVLKIVLAGGGNFKFNALDFSAFDFSGTGSQTLKVEGFLGGSAVGRINTHWPIPRFSIRITIIGPRNLPLYWPAKASRSSISC